MRSILNKIFALVVSLVLSSPIVAQNVDAPDAPTGGSGQDVLAASNAAGSSDKVLTFAPTPGSPDQSYTIVIKDKDGDVEDTVFVESGNSPPVTVPAGGKAYIHDTDPASPADSDNVTGTATLT